MVIGDVVTGYVTLLLGMLDRPLKWPYSTKKLQRKRRLLNFLVFLKIALI